MILLLLIYFLLLSPLAFGGASAMLSDMYHYWVEIRHVLTAADFAHLVSLAQAAPGPNVMVVFLLGAQIAGPGGAIISLLAMCTPSSILAFVVAGQWQHPRFAVWRYYIRSILVPIASGLILASAALMLKTSVHSAAAWLLSLATAVLLRRTTLNPLGLLAIGTLLGWFGVLG